MKKIVLFIFLSCTGFLFSQVNTVPTIPTANSEITVTFNATGTPLANYTGDVYAHTGITANGVRWQNVIGTWGTNTTQPKLTRSTSNANLYTLVITPTVYEFYGVATTVVITELNFVFRSSDGNTKNGPDIFIPIYAAGLNIAFTNPTNNSAYNLNSSITISAEASVASNLELFVNGTSIKTATNATAISTSYVLPTAGNQILKAVATNGTEVKETTINIFVKTPTVNATKPVGLKYGFNKNTDNSVTFLLKVPLKNDVLILGDFNNWTLNATFQMKKDGEDFWLTIPGLDINTEYAYQYFIDYSIKVADPYSEKILDPSNDQYITSANYPNLKAYPVNLTTGNVSTFKINQENYVWTTANFIKPSQSNLIIYELLIRDFTASSSFNEAITKLDYLASLGVNAIELMPINEFEGNDSWGYNPSLYMALDKAYGTKNDFKKFVDACHQRGIAVLADVVFNHSYGQSPLLQMYFDSANNKPAANNPWYNQQSNFANPDAQWGYDFNHESAYTKAFFNDVLSYWMEEYKIDGFRFDFTKGFSNTAYGTTSWGSDYDESRITILKNYADHVWSNNPTNKPYVIFEHLSDNSEETVLANYGIMLWGNINHSYNQNTMGFSSGSDISWISYKQRNWTNPNVVGYMESHDEERLMYKNLQSGNSNTTYNIKNLNTALSRQELAGMFFFTIPGPKMIWQFGELGYDFSINTCTDGTVSNNCRLSKKPIRWDYFDNANRKQIYNTWATLTAFKKQYSDVFNTTNFTLNTGNTLTKSIVLRGVSTDVVIVGNFDVTAKSITANFTKTGIWHEYFTGEEKNITSTSTEITLNPGEYKLYSTVKLLDPRGGTASDDSDGDGVADTIDKCPNTLPGTNVNSTGCPIFTLPAKNFTVEVISETCPNRNNGKISISASETHNYIAVISGISTDGGTPINISDKTFTNNSLLLNNLQPGIYTVCISVSGETYVQCFEIKVIAGEEILADVNVTAGKASVEIKKGTAPYIVYVNGQELFKTSAPIFSVDVKGGDILEVKTAVSCEGIYSKTINGIDGVFAYPNPTQGAFEITVPTSQTAVVVELYNINSQLISAKKYPVVYGKVQLSLANKPIGVYIAKVLLDQPVTLKIIKQ